MQAFLYRWRLLAGREAVFTDAWTRATEILLQLGRAGSRLHRGDDGGWSAYARRNDDATRQRAFATANDVDGFAAAVRAMRDAVVESSPPVTLDIAVDRRSDAR